MKSNRCAFVGSFDPFHIGHLEIVRVILRNYKEVFLIVADNRDKNHDKKLEVRFIILKKMFAKLMLKNKNFKILMLNKNDDMPSFLAKNKILTVIRGLRNNKDLFYELNLKKAYKEINPNLEFVYIKTDTDISSSAIKEEYD